jgi:hypothetical protein
MQSSLFEIAWKKMEKFQREKALCDLYRNPGFFCPRDITQRQDNKLAHS